MLLLGTNLPITKLMWFAFRKNNVPPEVLAAYSAPFPSPLFKAGAARWPLLVPLLKDDPVTAHMAAARNCLKTWRKPVLVMFGDSDPITRTAESLFLNLVPHSKAGFTSKHSTLKAIQPIYPFNPLLKRSTINPTRVYI